jgi:hypothetical protein
MSHASLTTFLKELQEGRYRTAFYQRTPEWDFARECKFMHSMLRDTSTGLFLINHVNTPGACSRRIAYKNSPQYDLKRAKFEICDGLQRTTTLLRCSVLDGYENPFMDKKSGKPRSGTFAINCEALEKYVKLSLAEVFEDFLTKEFFTVLEGVSLEDPSTFKGYFPLCLVFETDESTWMEYLPDAPSIRLKASLWLMHYRDKELLFETLKRDLSDADLQAVFHSVNKNGKVMSDETYSKSCISSHTFDAHKAVEQFETKIKKKRRVNKTMREGAYSNILRSYMLTSPAYTTTQLSHFVVSRPEHYTYIRDNWNSLTEGFLTCLDEFLDLMPFFEGGKITDSMTVALMGRWRKNPDLFHDILQSSGEDQFLKWVCFGTITRSEEGGRKALYEALVSLEKGLPLKLKGYVIDRTKIESTFSNQTYVEHVRAAEAWMSKQVRQVFPKHHDLVWIDPETDEEVCLTSSGETISNLVLIPKKLQAVWRAYPTLREINGYKNDLSITAEERAFNLAQRYREFFDSD